MTESLSITGCTIVDVAKGATSVGDLHIAGGRLIEGPPPPDSIHGRLDASGMFAIPGLIDMHVHMTSDPTGRAVGQWSNLTTTIEVLTAVDNLALALATGVTTVRDLGTRGRLGYDIQAAWVRGSFVGARPVVAGPVITSIGGHGSWLGVESEGMHHIPSLVRKNVADGSRVIKLMMSSAARTIELRPEEVAAAVAEAHWHEVPVAVHANFSERSIDTAVSAGCDTLEHGFSISADTASLMAEQGTCLCATSVALQSIVDKPGPVKQSARRNLVDRAVAHLPLARSSFERAADAGVTLIAGTDAGVIGVTFDYLPRELATMVRWGAPPVKALQAATCAAARALRRPVVQGGVVRRLESPNRLSGLHGDPPPGQALPGTTSRSAGPAR